MWRFVFVAAAVFAVGAEFNVPKEALLFASEAGVRENVHCLTLSVPDGIGCLKADLQDMASCYSLVTQSDPDLSPRFNPSAANLSEWPSMHIRDVLQNYDFHHFHSDFMLNYNPVAFETLPPLVLAWYCQSHLQQDPHIKRSSEFFFYDGASQRCYFANALPEIPLSNPDARFIAGPQYCDGVVIARRLSVDQSINASNTDGGSSQSEATHVEGPTVTTPEIILVTTTPQKPSTDLGDYTTADTEGYHADGALTTAAELADPPPAALPTAVAVGAAFGGIAALGAVGIGSYFVYQKTHSTKKSRNTPDLDAQPNPNFGEVLPTASFFM